MHGYTVTAGSTCYSLTCIWSIMLLIGHAYSNFLLFSVVAIILVSMNVLELFSVYATSSYTNSVTQWHYVVMNNNNIIKY